MRRRSWSFLLGGMTIVIVCILILSHRPSDLDHLKVAEIELMEHKVVYPLQISLEQTHALQMHLPDQLLQDYRNPCWVETLPSDQQSVSNIYTENFFNQKDCFYRKSLDRMFAHMNQVFIKRSEVGQNWRIRCFPHYFLIGAPKSGSTDLYDYLHMHPHLVDAARKEPEFWNDRMYGRIMNPGAYMCPGTSDKGFMAASVQDYMDLYDEAAEEILNIVVLKNDQINHPVVVGDHTPATLFDLGEQEDFPTMSGTEDPLYTNAHYIYSMYSKAKLVLLLRDPVERAFSQYRVHQGASPEGFHQHVLHALNATVHCLKEHSERFCAYHRSIIPMSLRVGLYAVFVKDWLQVFPRDQLLVIRFEDYVKKPVYWVNMVFQHIGLEPINSLQIKRDIKNKGTSSFQMLPTTRRLLTEFYEPWNKRLTHLLNDNAFLWTTSS